MTLRAIAAREFDHRREQLRAAVHAGTISPDDANHRAQLWLGIAAHFGEHRPEAAVPLIWPEGAWGQLRPDQIADPEEMRQEAARARDRAIAQAEARRDDPLQAPRLIQRARELRQIAQALGPAPLVLCRDQEERKAA